MAAIVFIHSMSEENEQKWLTQFRRLLPEEQVVLANELTEQQALEVEIAIAANPDIEVLERFPNLIWVQSLWAGVESLVDGFRSFNRNKKVPAKLVRLIDPFLADTMAEAVLAWTLYLHRNMPQYRALQQEQRWQVLPCPAALDVRVTVLGAGELGLAAMQLLLRHGYQVKSWSRSAKEISGVSHYSGDDGLVQVLASTDILVCLLPLTQQTSRLLNQETLSLVPKGGKFINFARGGVVDHQDLQSLLDREHLAHAVLDVFDQEPLPENSPLWRHAKITVLPHISATTNLATASQVTADNILEYRRSGTVPEAVDLDKGY